MWDPCGAGWLSSAGPETGSSSAWLAILTTSSCVFGPGRRLAVSERELLGRKPLVDESELGILIIFGVMGLMAALCLVLARKMRSGTLGPNMLVGIRTPATLRSADAWYAGHRAAVPQITYCSPVFGVTAVGALVNAVVDGPQWVVGVMVIISAALVLPPMVWAGVVAPA